MSYKKWHIKTALQSQDVNDDKKNIIFVLQCGSCIKKTFKNPSMKVSTTTGLGGFCFMSYNLKEGKGNINYKHGMTNTREFKSWISMKTRCYNPNSKGYQNYGGRGITICDRWKDSFINFYEDMGERPEGTSLDRIDVNGNYEPSNCRWADSIIQNRNRNKLRSNTSGVTGVSFNNIEKKWRARISTNEGRKELGFFKSKEDAISARKKAELKYWNE